MEVRESPDGREFLTVTTPEFGAASWQHWGLLQIGLGTSKIMFRSTLRVLFKLARIRPEA